MRQRPTFLLYPSGGVSMDEEEELQGVEKIGVDEFGRDTVLLYTELVGVIEIGKEEVRIERREGLGQ